MARRARAAFALPSILIASIVMLIVLSFTLSSVATTRVALDEQYYTTLAKEAAESGSAKALLCLRKSQYQPKWSSSEPLALNTNCKGEVISGQTQYLVDGAKIRTSFEVDEPGLDGANGLVVSAIGKTELVRSNGTVWKVYTSDIRVAASYMVLSAASYVDSGALQVCGIFDEHTWCWGSQLHGRLGNGVNESELILEPIKVTRSSGALQGRSDKYVAVGDGNMCIVTADNNIYCAGRNNTGQVGDGTNTVRTVPTRVAKPAGMTGEATGITAGRGFFCAISGGNAWCWGAGTLGRLGDGVGGTNRNVPYQVAVIGASRGKPVFDIASDAESLHACALTREAGKGKAYCWGYNGRGELGDNSTSNQKAPVAVYSSGVLSGKDLVKISASGRYAERGRDIHGETPNDAELISMVAAESVAPRKRQYARTGQTCALDSAGRMYCWGSNNYGQLGTGGSHPSYLGDAPPWRQTTPIAVTTAGLSGKVITDMAVARPATCAVVGSENKIYCWGLNDRGILGRGPGVVWGYYPEGGEVVSQTPGIAGQAIESITGGANRFCVKTDTDTIYCWGVGGTAGQLGDGSQEDRPVPTEATMLKQLIDLRNYY